MARSFSYYYVPVTVRSINNYTFNSTSIKSSDLMEGTLMMGIRLQTEITDNESLSEKIGFVSDEYVQTLIGSLSPTPSIITFSDQSDAMRAGLLKRVNFSLVRRNPYDPVAEGKGDPYNVFLVYPSALSDYQISDILVGHEFVFSGVKYRVNPRTIKPFRSKGSTPSYSGFGPPPPGSPGVLLGDEEADL